MCGVWCVVCGKVRRDLGLPKIANHSRNRHMPKFPPHQKIFTNMALSWYRDIPALVLP